MVKKQTSKISRPRVSRRMSRPRVSRRMSRPRVSRGMHRPRVSRRMRRTRGYNKAGKPNWIDNIKIEITMMDGRILNYIRTTNTHIVDLLNLIDKDTGLDRKQMDLYNETIGSIAELSKQKGSQRAVLNYTLKEIQDKILYQIRIYMREARLKKSNNLKEELAGYINKLHERKKILKFTLVLYPDIWSSLSLRHADTNSKYDAKDERYYKKKRQSHERYTRPFVLREIARRHKT